MKKITICILLSIIITILLPISTVAQENINTETYNIAITSGDTELSIKETIILKDDGSNDIYNSIYFWIHSNAEDVTIYVNSNPAEPTTSGNEYICNITELNITMDSQVEVTISYTLSNEVENFQKTLTYPTSTVTIKFDGIDLYTGENLQTDTSINLLLYKPTETPLSSFVIITIMLLVVLLVVTTLYAFKKQKTTKVKDTSSIGSEELLSTKKALLMTVLKDIEKQHRAKKISDDTYHKLKEEYKQHAVETMKKLEDLK